MSSEVKINPNCSHEHTQTYHCGTLTYTKVGLAMLFGWLLWGDFCFTLMEAVVPSILPLKLKGLGAPNWLMGVIMTAGPGILNMTICPYVSFKSDRYRSSWGRRIPFIVWTMPFLCAFLALLGWSDDICVLLQRHSSFLRDFTPATITIALIAVFMIMFQFFNMFVGSVFWYLFNDVVPAQFLGRFMGTFRIIGVGAGALYSCFIFQYANSHMREIFIGVAVLYLIGFGLMCLMVREGKYPPIEEEDEQNGKGFEAIKTFFRESFSHKFYWFRFLATGFSAVAGAIGVFTVFFNQEMGLSLDQIGKISGISAIAVMAATFFMAVFIDRWHPLRICVYAAVFGVININWVWIFVTLPGNYFFWISIGSGLMAAFLSALVGVAGLPSEMRMFPQSRFGQFCSAQAMFRSLCTIIAGVAAGLFIDLFKWFCNGSDSAYRFIHIWIIAFTAVSALFMVLVYREWNRMGGDKHFHPPAPWSPKGIEEMPITTTVGPQTRWLKLAWLFFDGVMLMPTLCIPFLMWWMYTKNQLLAFRWYGLAVLPLFIAACILWAILKKRICQDMTAAKKGLPLRNGIPHHGLLLLVGSQYLLIVGIWLVEIYVTITMNKEGGAIAFGVAKGLTNILLVGAIWLLARIERGYSTVIDTNLSVAADDLENAQAEALVSDEADPATA